MEKVTLENLENYCNQMLKKASENEDGSNEYHRRYLESLDTFQTIERNSMEYYSNEEKIAVEREKLESTKEIELKKQELEYSDKEQRLQLETRKADDLKEIEDKKQKITAPRMVLELLKVFGPAVIAAAVTIRMQNKAGISEEKGIAWRSEVSKMANGQKPNLWKW